MTKPFGMAELEAWIRVHTRRGGGGEEQATEITVGPIAIDTVHHQARLDGTQVDLTAREFDLLAFLARHAGRICTHQMILRQVWGTGYGKEAQYLHVYVHRLRRKLGDDGGRLIKTVPGIGYELAEPPVPAPAPGATGLLRGLPGSDRIGCVLWALSPQNAPKPNWLHQPPEPVSTFASAWLSCSTSM